MPPRLHLRHSLFLFFCFRILPVVMEVCFNIFCKFALCGKQLYKSKIKPNKCLHIKSMNSTSTMTTIKFQIDYTTKWGECICVYYKTLQNDLQETKLHTENGKNWTGEISVQPFSLVEYHYAVVEQDTGKTLRTMRPKALKLQTKRNEKVFIFDHWAAGEIPDVFLHTAFSKCVFKTQAQTSIPITAEEHNMLRLHTTPPPAGYSWGIVGSSEHLGRWQIENAKRLVHNDTYEFYIPLSDEEIEKGIEYKYVLIKENASSEAAIWENGENRSIQINSKAEITRLIINDGSPRIDYLPWRGAGIVIPVFSLKSEGSQGIGDFGDLKEFIEWSSRVGFRCVQILPINDTTSSGTWRDSYPYNGISVFALHPIYLNMRNWENWNRFENYKNKISQLNALPKVDYEAVFSMKMAFLSELYLAFGEDIMNKSSYQHFFESNKEWLVAYAAYSLEKSHSLGYSRNHDLEFFYFTQYLLHQQMLEAHDTARSHGVILKGDIPIGVCADSVPATVCPQLFHFNGSAGAPPDAFAREGQNWGFPTYNWDYMAKDNYLWWKSRLKSMEQYFDAYRIDHVLGFFRIWEVPSCQIQGIMGHFRPALPLSKQEIRDTGFESDIEAYTQPFVTQERKEVIENQFPYENINQFLCTNDGHIFHLCENANTQRKIAALNCNEALKKTLMSLVAEVLFLKDPDGNGYHPRILGHETEVFKTLGKESQEAYHRLYENFFYHRHNDFWAYKALEKMTPIMCSQNKIEENSMLPCAEDLGMVPASVKDVLNKLQILSLEIQRMPKKWGVRFDNLQENPYLSVSTIATHDMPPFRLWWHENREQTQAFYQDVLHQKGEAPQDTTPQICEQVVKAHLDSPSMLCIISLQDYLAIDKDLRNPHYEEEQINVPANPNQYWNYRMHLTIEKLISASAFNEKIRLMIENSGR